jgi:hypothetical protein
MKFGKIVFLCIGVSVLIFGGLQLMRENVYAWESCLHMTPGVSCYNLGATCGWHKRRWDVPTKAWVITQTCQCSYDQTINLECMPGDPPSV